jgi:Uma2 family endonuclease
MTALKTDKITVDEFLEWCLSQEECYELVDGLPRLKWGQDLYDPRLRTGTRSARDNVVLNGIVALGSKLGGGPHWLHTIDEGIALPMGDVRRADLFVSCRPENSSDFNARDPVFVVEVLSRSVRNIDLLRKWAEYKKIVSLRYLLMIDPDEVRAIFHERLADGRWTDIPLIGRDTEIHMPEINVSLTLGEFYEGLDV